MLLELTNITKRYDTIGAPTGDADVVAAPAVLSDVNLQVAAGESLSIVGPSGSGKSTLLHIIGTLDTPTSGIVMLDGQDITKLDEDALAHVRNTQIGFIFQAHHLLPQCSVLENVLIPTLVTGNAAASKDRAKQLLDRVGLSHRLTHRPAQLSGGEQQRVAVVRALINEPKLLLADEPTGALDKNSAETLATLLLELNKEEGVTLIAVTHAKSLADQMGRVMELDGGALVNASNGH